MAEILCVFDVRKDAQKYDKNITLNKSPSEKLFNNKRAPCQFFDF